MSDLDRTSLPIRRGRAIKYEVGEAEGHHVKALKGALAEAQQKMAAEGA